LKEEIWQGKGAGSEKGMAAKKERCGAYVKPGPIEVDKKGFKSGEYIISIGKYDKILLEKGEMFTSSPEISKRIAAINGKHELKGKVRTGYIRFFTFLVGPKVVRIGGYWPFTRKRYEVPFELGKKLKGFGLASRIDLMVLKDLKKKFPGHKVVVQPGTAQGPLRTHLIKRGSYQFATDFIKPFEFREEIQRIADYVGLKGMEKREGKSGVKRLLAARKKARARKQAGEKRQARKRHK